MRFLFIATATFDRSAESDHWSWNNYIAFSKLSQVWEIVSLDGMLNKRIVEPDYNDEEYWNHLHIDGQLISGLFTSAEYLLVRIDTQYKFNLLTVVVNPEQDCNQINVDGYDFMGYELLDKDYCNSVLTNCGGFENTFSPAELNAVGLLDNYVRAVEVCRKLVTDYPDHPHAETNVLAVWRHETTGRTGMNEPADSPGRAAMQCHYSNGSAQS